MEQASRTSPPIATDCNAGIRVGEVRAVAKLPVTIALNTKKRWATINKIYNSILDSECKEA